MEQKPQEMKRSEGRLDDKPAVYLCAYMHVCTCCVYLCTWYEREGGRGEGQRKKRVKEERDSGDKSYGDKTINHKHRVAVSEADGGTKENKAVHSLPKNNTNNRR